MEQLQLHDYATHASAHPVPFVPSGVELVSRATFTSRKKRNRETCWRQSKALKRVQREAKRKLVAQPEISHEAAEAILRGQETRNFLYHTRQPPAPSATRPREFSWTCLFSLSDGTHSVSRPARHQSQGRHSTVVSSTDTETRALASTFSPFTKGCRERDASL